MTPATADGATEFSVALLDPTQPVPEGLFDGDERPAGRRFDVYRNNVVVSLGEAILTGFPILTKLLGEANIKGMAAVFCRAHPPNSPLMTHFGSDLPAFLDAAPQLAHIGYLGDIARLELAMRQSYHAADAKPIDPALLGQMPPETLVQSYLGFAPATRVLRSKWPIYDIWRFNSEENAPKPKAGAQDVLVARPEFDPEPHVLPLGGADWIARINEGATIGDALAATQNVLPEFDLGATLGVLLQSQSITHLSTEKAPR